MTLTELGKTIKERYPKLSERLVSTIMPNVFSRMAELEFPLNGDDDAFVEWFNLVYQPAMRQTEDEMHLGDWY